MSEGATPKSNLALRLLTAGLWVPFILWMLFWGPPAVFFIVAALVCALGTQELMAMVAGGAGHRLLRGYAVIAGLAVYSLIALTIAQAALALGLIGLTCAGLLIATAHPEPVETAALRMAWTVAAPLYLGGTFGAITWLYLERGGGWVLLSLMCSFLSDTAGYFVGRALGRRPLSSISPKKTVEGSIGGLLGGLASGLLAHYWFLSEISLLNALALSLLATMAGQAGDLCESLIKRSNGVKDSGTGLSRLLLRGHGGILDRADAMMFSAATVWGYAQLF